MNKKVVKKSIVSYILLAVVILGVIYFFNVLNKKVNDLSYSEFINAMNKGEVTELTITPSGGAGIYQEFFGRNGRVNWNLMLRH